MSERTFDYWNQSGQVEVMTRRHFMGPDRYGYESEHRGVVRDFLIPFEQALLSNEAIGVNVGAGAGLVPYGTASEIISRVWNCDFAPVMTEKCPTHWPQPKGWKLFHAGRDRWPFEDDSLDAGVSLLMMRYLHVREQEHAMSEMLRVTKPGAVVSVMDLVRSGDGVEVAIFDPNTLSQHLSGRIEGLCVSHLISAFTYMDGNQFGPMLGMTFKKRS